MHQDCVACRIMNRIEEYSATDDFVYTSADFIDLGEYHAVRQALVRLEKSGIIQRIIRGVYYKPRYSELIREYSAPSPSKVAEAIARKYNWTIAPCGETALNLMGLSTQVPAKWSYISDGPYHQFQVGNLTIEFKHRNNREISGMSFKTAAVIQALKALGKENIGETQINIIKRNIKEEEKATILKEGRQSSVWIYDMIKRICV